MIMRVWISMVRGEKNLSKREKEYDEGEQFFCSKDHLLFWGWSSTSAAASLILLNDYSLNIRQVYHLSLHENMRRQSDEHQDLRTYDHEDKIFKVPLSILIISHDADDYDGRQSASSNPILGRVECTTCNKNKNGVIHAVVQLSLSLALTWFNNFLLQPSILRVLIMSGYLFSLSIVSWRENCSLLLTSRWMHTAHQL